MQLAIIVTVISFFLESIVSNFVSINSDLFLPLFTIVSLVIIYPYLKKERANYYKIAAVLGLFYDIVYTDTLILNLFLFVMTAYFITKMNYILSNNSSCFFINTLMSYFLLHSLFSATILFNISLFSINNFIFFDSSS